MKTKHHCLPDCKDGYLLDPIQLDNPAINWFRSTIKGIFSHDTEFLPYTNLGQTNIFLSTGTVLGYLKLAEIPCNSVATAFLSLEEIFGGNPVLEEEPEGHPDTFRELPYLVNYPETELLVVEDTNISLHWGEDTQTAV